MYGACLTNMLLALAPLPPQTLVLVQIPHDSVTFTNSEVKVPASTSYNNPFIEFNVVDIQTNYKVTYPLLFY